MRPLTAIARFFETTGAHHPMKLRTATELRKRMLPWQLRQLDSIVASGQEDSFAGFDATVVAGLDRSGNRDLRMDSVIKFQGIINGDKFNSLSTDTLLLSDYDAKAKSWNLLEGGVRAAAIATTSHIVLVPIRVGVSRDVLLNDNGTQVKPHMAVYRWANFGARQHVQAGIVKYVGTPQWTQGMVGRLVAAIKCVHTPTSARRQGMTTYDLAQATELLCDNLWTVVEQFSSGDWTKDYTFKSACHMAPFVIALANGMDPEQVHHALAVFTRQGSFEAEALNVGVMHSACAELKQVPMLAGANSRDFKERAAISILLTALDQIRNGNGNGTVLHDLAFGRLLDTQVVLKQWTNPLLPIPGLKQRW